MELYDSKYYIHVCRDWASSGHIGEVLKLTFMQIRDIWNSKTWISSNNMLVVSDVDCYVSHISTHRDRLAFQANLVF